MIVDCHTHYVPRTFTRALAAGERPFGYEQGPEGAIVHPAGPVLPVGYAELHEPAAKLAVLDGQGVDAAVVSITPHLFVQAGEAGVRFAREANEELATFVAGDRLVGIGTLPMDRPAEAARELEHGVRELGLRGAILGTGHPDGRLYARADLEPLFEAAEGLGVPLMLHPFYAGPVQDQTHFLANSIGVPLDTLLGTVAIFYTGLLDRWPGVRLILPHGGGYLPYQLGRLDNGWRAKPACRGGAERTPSAYLEQCFFDTVLHEPAALRFLTELAGPERLLLGTDAPYVTGEADPVGFVTAAGADPAALGANAARLFAIDGI